MKLLYALFVCVGMLSVPACKKFTDIQPKGKNLLNTVNDLDLLLNFNYHSTGNATESQLLYAGSTAFRFLENNILVNDLYPYPDNSLSLISSPAKGLTYALLTYDESIDRKSLAVSDIKYEKMYFIISAICNIVLDRADIASGDRQKASQIKAEALVLRAWFHYLLVNLYAKAYDPATVATDGGIPYVTDTDIEAPNAKSTVAEVYQKILADLDAAFQLNALPNVPVNNERAGKGFAYGVKAKVLLSMRDYAGALQAADAGLAINSSIDDHRNFLPPVGNRTISKKTIDAPDNLFYATITTTHPFDQIPSLELLNNVYEPGNIIRDSTATYNVSRGPAISGIAGTKTFFSATWSVNTAGITTMDLYLTRAECLARTTKVNEAMTVINFIRERRMKPYVALTATTEAQAMAYLARTSRIEYLFTPKNYLDIKRWNTEAAYKQTISKTINGITYQLKPDSKLWIFPFPQSATNYNPLLTQNY